MQKSTPIRMCISCKLKAPQKTLARYHIVDGKIICGKGDGRSFYLCYECLKRDENTLKKTLMRYSRGSIDEPNLKEKLLDGKC